MVEESIGPLDPMSAGFVAISHEEYAHLRARGAIVHISLNGGVERHWVMSYAAARAVLSDPRFSVDLLKADVAAREAHLRSLTSGQSVPRDMLSVDSPDHERLRRLVSTAFTPRRAEGMRPRIQELVDQRLDAIAPRGEADLMADLAVPFPFRVTAELLDVPGDDVERMHALSAASIRPPLTDADRRSRASASAEIRASFERLIEGTRASVDPVPAPEDQPTLVAALIAARDHGERLTSLELIEMLELLLIASNHTVSDLIGNAFLALLRHPNQRQLLADRPELLRGAIEETLRYDGSVELSGRRIALEDVELEGVHIPKGSMVNVVMASANRDPSRYPDPDTFDIARGDMQHLGFGHGIHFCLGAPLARIEAQAAIGSTFRRFPDLELARRLEGLRWRERGGGGGGTRGLAALPVRFTPERG